MNTITIEDMQRDLRGYLREVRAGTSLVILEADRPVAELKPFVAADGPALGATALSAEDEEARRLEAEIDHLYGEIRDLMVRAADEPHDDALLEQIEQKQKSLRRVQEREAEIMERRAAARLRFDPAEGKKLLAHAARLLER